MVEKNRRICTVVRDFLLPVMSVNMENCPKGVIITGMIRAGSSGFHKPGYFTIAYWKVM
jgi:hypothetical protein